MSKLPGKHNICNAFSGGRCPEAANGQCGPNSCSKRPQFIHACDACGEVGHMSSNCSQAPAKGAIKDGNKRRKRGKKN